MVKWKKHLQLGNVSYELKSDRVSMKEISVYLGHRSVVVTERVYAKYSPNFMKESSSVMADVINIWDRNVIMWHRQVFFSCKSLILKDKRWYALGERLCNDFNDLDEMSHVFCFKVFRYFSYFSKRLGFNYIYKHNYFRKYTIRNILPLRR